MSEEQSGWRDFWDMINIFPIWFGLGGIIFIGLLAWFMISEGYI